MSLVVTLINCAHGIIYIARARREIQDELVTHDVNETHAVILALNHSKTIFIFITKHRSSSCIRRHKLANLHHGFQRIDSYNIDKVKVLHELKH